MDVSLKYNSLENNKNLGYNMSKSKTRNTKIAASVLQCLNLTIEID